MTRPLQISPEVAALLPAESITRARTDPGFATIVCSVCTKTIPPDQPAAMVVYNDPALQLQHLVFAHPTCQASAVVVADLSGIVAADGYSIQVSAGLIQPINVPTVFVETLSNFAAAAGADLVDLVVQAGLDRGLHLVTDARAVLPALAAPGGWHATFTPLGTDDEFRFDLGSPDGPFTDGATTTYAPWPEWAEAIRRTGTIQLYLGTSLISPDGAHSPDVLTNLAAAGRLAGATIPARVLAG